MATDQQSLKVRFIDLGLQYKELRDEVLAKIDEVSVKGEYILGPEVKRFEESVAQFIGTKYALGVGNGADALFLAIKALDIGAGDEVITQANSFIASAGAIVAAGAKPVLVDVGDDMNMDPVQLERAITPQTKAIMPVHLWGKPCDMEAIMQIAQKHGLFVIEDAAQAIGATYNGQRVGSFGVAGCFSLHPLKNLHAMGDAGFLTTNDEALYNKVQKLRNHGLRNRDECEFFGYNSRLDNLQAAVLNIKLKHLAAWTQRIRAIAHRYRSELGGVANVPKEEPHEEHVYHRFVIMTPLRDELQSFLLSRGIETKVHYPIPIHLQDAARGLGYPVGSFPFAEQQSRMVLSLPLYAEMTDEQVSLVISEIKAFFLRKRGATMPGQEVDLMRNYPRSKRNLDERAAERTSEDIAIARKFGKDFFDGDRKHGYGGYTYHARFWTPVVPDFVRFYGLKPGMKILDIGCGRGFMLHDFKKFLPGLIVKGIDISEYAISTAMPEMKPFVEVGNANDLSGFKDKEFDLVISINTLHNLPREECRRALAEVSRIGKRAFIVNDAWRNPDEERRMKMWNLTAQTFMSTQDWKKFFSEAGYTGDYYWFIP